MFNISVQMFSSETIIKIPFLHLFYAIILRALLYCVGKGALNETEKTRTFIGSTVIKKLILHLINGIAEIIKQI